MKYILGIDPGLSGSLSIICVSTGEHIDLIDMPTKIDPKVTSLKALEAEHINTADHAQSTVKKRKKKTASKAKKKAVSRTVDCEKMHEWLAPYAPDIELAVLEKVASMTGQGVVSVFKFGEVYGSIKSCLQCLGIRFWLVSPSEWQKYFDLILTKGMSSTEKKTLIYKGCAELYPDVEFHGPKGGLKDGRSDATLIARWGFEMLKQYPSAASVSPSCTA